jgi:hypothetical protein
MEAVFPQIFPVAFFPWSNFSTISDSELSAEE